MHWFARARRELNGLSAKLHVQCYFVSDIADSSHQSVHQNGPAAYDLSRVDLVWVTCFNRMLSSSARATGSVAGSWFHG